MPWAFDFGPLIDAMWIEAPALPITASREGNLRLMVEYPDLIRLLLLQTPERFSVAMQQLYNADERVFASFLFRMIHRTPKAKLWMPMGLPVPFTVRELQVVWQSRLIINRDVPTLGGNYSVEDASTLRSIVTIKVLLTHVTKVLRLLGHGLDRSFLAEAVLCYQCSLSIVAGYVLDGCLVGACTPALAAVHRGVLAAMDAAGERLLPREPFDVASPAVAATLHAPAAAR